MIYGRLAHRLRALHLPNFTVYRDYIAQPQNSGELTELVNALTTPVSHFWREPHHFEHLATVTLPWIVAEGRQPRLWSAGCAAGQEAYMLAMVLERAKLAGRILATDVNTNALRIAKAGQYDAQELARLPLSWRKEHWQQSGTPGRWQANPALQEKISFRPLNLQAAWPLQQRFDAIFCRNVMIYFDTPTKRQLLKRFAALLNPGGWLYIGHAENILPLNTRFKSVGRTIYRLEN